MNERMNYILIYISMSLRCQALGVQALLTLRLGKLV